MPLLVLTQGLDERVAAATSLAAIGIIALSGAIDYGIRGHLEVGPAALVGLPAAAGAVGGAALQQRLGARTLALAFAALLSAVGIRLIVA